MADDRNNFTIAMVLKRETKGTWLYEPLAAENAAITGLYIRKTGFNGSKRPTNIVISVTDDDRDDAA